MTVWDRALERSAERERPYLRLQRALAVAHSGDHKRAADEAGELAGRSTLSVGMVYDLGCVFALCTAAAQQDTQLPEADRNKVAEAYAVRAVEMLQRAQAAGFFKNPAQLRNAEKDPDLDALRQRADFMKLWAEVKPKDAPGQK
jgi:hypothetical protein